MSSTYPIQAPVVLTCAVTGNLTTREQTPFLPVTPAEIAASALEAAKANMNCKLPISADVAPAICLNGSMARTVVLGLTKPRLATKMKSGTAMPQSPPKPLIACRSSCLR